MAMANRTRRWGASVRIPPVDAGRITFALVTDPEGNPVGLIQKEDEAAKEFD